PPLNPETLCEYCDEELPAVQSDALLFNLSYRDPLPHNSLHHKTPHVTMTVEYCDRHRFETIYLPKALAGGWPFKPDFEHLFR
ncbi:hypothetical protein C8R43DRAFT_906271, partial [Mycena crocata]